MDAYGGMKELAYRVSLLACIDYVDSLLVMRNGCLPGAPERLRRRIWNTYLHYSKNKLTDKHGEATPVDLNIKRTKRIARMIKDYLNIGEDPGVKNIARIEAERCEAFFKGGTFDVFMPNIGGDDIVGYLQSYAPKGQRIPGDDYKSIYPY